jgi:hypothetical protein
LLELFLCWPHLHTSLDSVGCQWSCTIDVPLVEYSLLSLGISTHKVIERLNVWLGSEHREGEIVILEVETNTGKVNKWLYAGLAELLGVTDTGSLKDKRRGESAARYDDLLACPDDP